MEQSDTRSHLFPNIFYDVIVFLTPTLTLLLGIATGSSSLDNVWKFLTTGQGSTLSVLIVSLVVFFVGYEYGRLAETFSDSVVALPLRVLKRLGLLRKGDFGRSLGRQVELLGVELAMFEGRTKSKWSLYFYAMQNAPLLGADLLKRYAWEKLARSAGFSFFLLSMTSAVTIIVNRCGGSSYFSADFGFGTAKFLLVALILYLLCLVDYYRRNAWNADLLITTIPIIVDEVRRRAPVEFQVNVGPTSEASGHAARRSSRPAKKGRATHVASPSQPSSSAE